MTTIEPPRPPLMPQSETEARRLGWAPGAAITWREFLEQYPFAADLVRARRPLPSVA